MSYKKDQPKKTEEEPMVEEPKTKQCQCEHDEESRCQCEGEGKECGCHGDKENKDCKCKDDKCDCSCECHDEDKQQKPDLAQEYLNMARIIQADFDNYRKRSIESIKQAKIDGKIEAIEVILPCLDVFKKAKQIVTDPSSLKGIEMVENEIQNSLKSLGVKKIETIGKPFDPRYHHALSTMMDRTKPDGVVLDEYQAGYIYNDKVIKYSQVIVNKIKEDKNE